MPARRAAAPALTAILLLALAPSANADPFDTQLLSRVEPIIVVGSDHSDDPSISADGRYVAFASAVDNLSTEDNNAAINVFVRDTVDGSIELVSRAAGATGAAADRNAEDASISADGRFVAFESEATNLTTLDDTTEDAGDPENTVFVRDLQEDDTVVASLTDDEQSADSNAEDPYISADGTHVAFYSGADNLSTSDSDLTGDVFVRDMVNGTTTFASRPDGASSTGQSDENSFPRAISETGRYVLFDTRSETITNQDANGVIEDAFLRDTLSGTTTLVSLGEDGSPGNDSTHGAAMTPDARYVVFRSYATNTSTEDNDTYINFFVRDLTGGTTTFVNRETGEDGEPDAGGTNASITADGRRVAFASVGENLSDEDAAGFVEDVFVRDLDAHTTTLISRATGEDGAAGNGGSGEPAISQDGEVVAFESSASNFGIDADSDRDIFARLLGEGGDPDPDPDPDPDGGGDGDGDGDGGSEEPPPLPISTVPPVGVLPPPPPPGGTGGTAGEPPEIRGSRRPTRVTSDGNVTTGILLECDPTGQAECVYDLVATAARAGGRAVAAQRTRLGRGRVRVRPGQTKAARFKLTRKALRTLKKRKRLRVSLSITGTRGTLKTTARRTLVLKRPKR